MDWTGDDHYQLSETERQCALKPDDSQRSEVTLYYHCRLKSVLSELKSVLMLPVYTPGIHYNQALVYIKTGISTLDINPTACREMQIDYIM